MKKIICGNESDKMPNWAFRIMSFMFDVSDIFSTSTKKLEPFNMQPGQTVIDYGSGTGRFIPPASAMVGAKGLVYALDMFHMVKDTDGFLAELRRLTKPDGVLYLEDGHQPRSMTREKVLKSGCWVVTEETKRFITCKPKLL